MLVHKKNIAFIAEQIQLGKSCRVSVFSETGFEVGYSVKSRFRAFNPKTCKYNGNWVEPVNELSKYLDKGYKVCASLYDKQEFARLIKESGLSNTADWCDCLENYLAGIDADLKYCLEEFGKPVLSWENFVRVASGHKHLIIQN